jgi:hypothetical protein
VQQVTEQASQQLADLKAEEKRLGRELAGYHRDPQRLAKDGLGEQALNGLADLHERVRATEQRLSEVCQQMNRIETGAVGEADVASALAQFDQVWAVLSPHEQAHLVRLLVERVVYDGRDGSVACISVPVRCAQRLSASTNERPVSSRRLASVYECSTPFGINERTTSCKSTSRKLKRSAQRLSASTNERRGYHETTDY